jgi:hypothetical protein
MLSCIGVSGPAQGLERLMLLWEAYRDAVPALDQYLPGWVKDFHIYYEMPHGFMEFVEARGLQKYFPGEASPGGEDSLEVWNRRSGYDITRSKFFAGNEQLVTACAETVFAGLRKWCEGKETSPEDLLLYELSSVGFWKPFSQALFHPWLSQPPRRVEIHGREVYICRENRWTMERAVFFAGHRELVGHILRKTESCLRKAVKHKHKLAADPRVLFYSAGKLAAAGLTMADLDGFIEGTVALFHRELSRVAVSVDKDKLVRIRKEAQGTQEKLTVEESTAAAVELPVSGLPPLPSPPLGGGWAAFFASLTPAEKQALALLCDGETDLKPFADKQGIMLEVLAEGINEKAADCIGDNVLEAAGGMVLYEEYKEIKQGLLSPQGGTQ